MNIFKSNLFLFNIFSLKLKSIKVVLLFYFYLLSSQFLFSQPKHLDTVSALVQYGNKYILDENFYLKPKPQVRLDSMLEVAQSDQKTNLLFLKSQMKVNSLERMVVIDSLFSIHPIRYDLINEIERMIYYIKDNVSELGKKLFDITGNSEFPSNEIYKVWNTKKLWNGISIDYDSSYIVLLRDSISSKNYVHPISKTTIKKYGGKITSKQGWRDGKRHNGVDVNCDQWDSLSCAFDGKVRFAKEFEGYGRVVVVRHFNGLETLYAHLAKIKVKPGQNLKAGDLIGLAGSSGNSEGSHLHFEIRFKDQVLNPENIIDFNLKNLKSDSLLIRKIGKSLVALPLENKEHIIERGDYPMKIATRYGMDILTFTELNQITSRTKLKVGESVRIK